MSKAVLILKKMPKSCEDCVCRKGNCCVVNGTIVDSVMKYDWCPLKELPGPLIHSETDSEMMSHYKAGWNDLYSTITRKNDYD